MAGFVVFLVLTLAALRSLQTAETGNKRVVLKKFGQCATKATLPIHFHTVTIRPNAKTHENVLSFNLTIREKINSFRVSITLWRCDSSGNPDGCEVILRDFNVTNVCEIMGRKNELWSDFMEHLDVPPSCPLKPGSYRMKNCPVNTDFMRYVPITNALYKARLTGWNGPRKIACVELEEQVIAFYKGGRLWKS